jgi:uncharacterized protein
MIDALLLAAGGVGVGLFGALLGLGGGILLVPLLTLGFGLPLNTAVATSLVSVIATSAGAAAYNVRAGRADVRLGLRLGGAAVLGALAGGILAGFVPERLIAALFAALLLYTATSLVRAELARRGRPAVPHDPHLPSAPDGPQAPRYRSHRLVSALAGSVGAGVVSALLGVGGGIVKVPLMHLVMRAPLHVATATSNYIMGVTAAAGSYVYLFRGVVAPEVAGPVVLGVVAGSFLGARLAPHLRVRWLTVIFAVVLIYTGVQMVRAAMGLT